MTNIERKSIIALPAALGIEAFVGALPAPGRFGAGKRLPKARPDVLQRMFFHPYEVLKTSQEEGNARLTRQAGPNQDHKRWRNAVNIKITAI
ncbi:MAG: hypothetical protein AAF934_01260 [Bacteroidota bacterium]